MSKSIHNPEIDAPIDTVVEGSRYIIDGGDTLHNVPNAHAKNLLERYGFLQVVETPAKEEAPEVESKSSAKRKAIMAKAATEEEEDGSEEDGEENADEGAEEGEGTEDDEDTEDGDQEEDGSEDADAEADEEDEDALPVKKPAKPGKKTVVKKGKK